MERKEFRELIKKKFKAMGFTSKKSIWYKVIDDEYMVAFYLDNSTYVKGYYMYCGYCYLPDELVFPENGGIYLDREWKFYFPMAGGTELDLSMYDFEDGAVVRGYTQTFQYELYTLEECEKLFETNYRHIFEPILNKGYGFTEYYKSNYRRLNRFGPKKLKKLCRLLDLDIDEIMCFLGKPEGWLESSIL